MKRVAILTAAVMSAGIANANDIDLAVDNFSKDGQIVSAVIKLTNNLDQEVSDVYVDCAFLREDKRAIDIGKELINRIDAKGYAYGKASIVTAEKVRYADCKVTNFDR